MHDTYQISEVMQIARKVGFAVKIRVYPAKDHAGIAEAFRRAGQEADIVITYFSYWKDTKPMIVAIAAIREKLRYSKIPKGLQGVGISFIITGLMGIAFMAFMGIKL